MAQMVTTSPVLGTPRWAGDLTDPELTIAHFPAKLDASQFTDKDAVTITVNANAAQNATSVTIVAATLPTGITKIPSGTVLYFGGQKVATLTADYTSGTTLSVAALPTALVTNDVATYLPYGTRKAIASGTLVGRTFAERASNANFGPAHYQDDEFFIVLYDLPDISINNNVEFYQNNRTVKENYLPNYTTISGNANLLATLRSKYRCIVGVR